MRSLRSETAADPHPMHPIYPASLAVALYPHQAQSNRDRGAKADGTSFAAGCHWTARLTGCRFFATLNQDGFMYRGFNLSVPEDYFQGYYDNGRGSHQNQKARVQSALDSFMDADGSLIASKLTADWFPSISSEVFISHSHQDSELAVRLAGFLNYEFNITSFIDSCVWGYSDELLRILDDEYCWQKDSETYNYRKRNRSTSHVHMMLSTALAKMMNNCECIIFLNTPKSIPSGDYIRGHITDSPWIYSEIAMTSLLQKRSPSDHRELAKSIARVDEALRIRYEVELNHLTKLSPADINKWQKNSPGSKGGNALDILYNFNK